MSGPPDPYGPSGPSDPPDQPDQPDQPVPPGQDSPEHDPHRNVWLPPPAGSSPIAPSPAGFPTAIGGWAPRFARVAIFGGVGAALAIMVFSGALGVTAINMAGGSFGGLVAVLVVALAFSPLIVGIIIALVAKRPRLRGFGLGLAIGWALWLIIGAGACVALIAAVSSGGGL
jgi:hypothetical protein